MRVTSLVSYGIGAVFTGQFGRDSESLSEVQEANFSADMPMPLHVDGEPIPAETALEVRAGAAQIEVLV